MKALVFIIVAAAVGGACIRTPQASIAIRGWMVLLVTQPHRPAALRQVLLRLTIRDPENSLMTVDGLTAVARMPEMSHEVTPIVFHAVSPGRYEATTTFSMDGAWVITLDGRRSGQTYTGWIPLQVGR